MPKITTIVEYNLSEALLIIKNTDFNVNGCNKVSFVNIDRVISIKYAHKGSKQDVIIEIDDNSRYQIRLGSKVCIKL